MGQHLESSKLRYLHPPEKCWQDHETVPWAKCTLNWVSRPPHLNENLFHLVHISNTRFTFQLIKAITQTVDNKNRMISLVVIEANPGLARADTAIISLGAMEEVEVALVEAGVVETKQLNCATFRCVYMEV